MAARGRTTAAAPVKQRIAVVWYKVTDLRTHDHEPLHKAHSLGLPVLHLFVMDPRWYRKTPLCGFPRTGPIRARFQLEALRDLSKRLEAQGHHLCIKRNMGTADAFRELCRDFQIDATFASREVCSEELRVEQMVRKTLQQHGMGSLQVFWTFELHHYDDLPEDLRRRGSNSYTGYKNIFHRQCRPRRPLPVPNMRASRSVHWSKSDAIPSALAELGLEEPPPLHPSAEFQWVGGETAALARVREYLFETDALALDYVGSTNTPREGNSCTKKGAMSRLSPWLAHGCISARYLVSEIKRYEQERHESSSTYWLVHELYWRDFVRFQSLLVGDRIFKIGGLYNKHPQWPWYSDVNALKAWIDGTTGLPFLDAAMREIKATGYSCHVGRETSAWFLICDLGLDWRMGAEWMESVLIDYEPAANWFCWVFVCLIRATGGNGFREIGHPQLAPRTRLQTVEIVFLSAQHDPDGEYIKRWVPELRDLPSGISVREPWRAFAEPVAALSRGKRSEGGGQAGVGPDRIQMARRTLTKGGAAVAVWWSCVRNATELKHHEHKVRWPREYPLPILPPASFFDVEKVAETARRQQMQKARRMNQLRQALHQKGYVKSLGSVAEISEADEDEDHDNDAFEREDDAPAKTSSRWQTKNQSFAGKMKGKGRGKGKGLQGAAARSDGHDALDNDTPQESYYGGQRFVYLEEEKSAGDSLAKKRRWGKAAGA
mmetsp:Transcript_18494/g.33988  ORF Transcript_18494/g.33988 Transcript_18494/m.33988 type:complete len:717 (-) Transcript_18494:306-2456(-)